jgi:hypothetical protein
MYLSSRPFNVTVYNSCSLYTVKTRCVVYIAVTNRVPPTKPVKAAIRRLQQRRSGCSFVRQILVWEDIAVDENKI